MKQLGTCSVCNGFLGVSVRACPHCGAELGRARKIIGGLSALAGGSAVSMTLMACYGPACVDDACSEYASPDADANAGDVHVRADVGVGPGDGATDAATDGAFDARIDASDASDASLDAPADGG